MQEHILHRILVRSHPTREKQPPADLGSTPCLRSTTCHQPDEPHTPGGKTPPTPEIRLEICALPGFVLPMESRRMGHASVVGRDNSICRTTTPSPSACIGRTPDRK